MNFDFELTNYAETYETDDPICPQSTFFEFFGSSNQIQADIQFKKHSLEN